MAPSTSVFSLSSPSNCWVTVVRSSSACRLTPPRRSRSALRRVSWLSACSRLGSSASGGQLGECPGSRRARSRAGRGCGVPPRRGARARSRAAPRCARAPRAASDTAACAARSSWAACRWAVSAAASASAAERRSCSALASSVMSFWRCWSIMAGSSASLAISASAPAMRSFSVAICWSAPAERVRQRSCSRPIAACRSVRARCSRSSVMSSVRPSLTRERRPAVAVCAAASSASSPSVPASVCNAASVSDRCVCASASASWAWLRASATAAILASVSRACRSMAVSTSRVCANLPCASRHSWRRRRSSSCAALRRLRRLLGRGACRLGRAARLGLLARQRAQPAALGQPRGGGGRHLRGGDEAVPAPQMALARDQTLAGLQQALQARAVRGSDDADLAQAARQLGRARDVGDQRLDAGGQRGIRLGGGVQAPMHAAPPARWAHRGRRPAPRRAPSRSLPPP